MEIRSLRNVESSVLTFEVELVELVEAVELVALVELDVLDDVPLEEAAFWAFSIADTRLLKSDFSALRVLSVDEVDEVVDVDEEVPSASSWTSFSRLDVKFE